MGEILGKIAVFSVNITQLTVTVLYGNNFKTYKTY